jgi:hypothetical protein
MLYRIAFFTLVPFLILDISAGELTLKQTNTGYEIRIDDQLFAGYVTNHEGLPIIYPIVGPTDKRMTRDYPMVENYDGVKADHPHHRSLWFAHGNVNYHDFWTMQYHTVHKRFIQAECDGQTALLVTENDWIDKDNQVVCKDVRTLRFSASQDRRIIDFDITITAEQDRVVFGDTKEGTFAVRVPEAIAVETKKGGQFVNAEGKLNEKEAWGKRSAWVDYTGILDGENVGIAIMNHPTSFRFPTHWHVREYGLFTANPFGIHEFEQLQNVKAGEHTLAKGESFSSRYRVLFHKGDTSEANIADAYKVYAAGEKK